jgi:hypothetical protein
VHERFAISSTPTQAQVRNTHPCKKTQGWGSLFRGAPFLWRSIEIHERENSMSLNRDRAVDQSVAKLAYRFVLMIGVVAFSMALQILALPIFVLAKKQEKRA